MCSISGFYNEHADYKQQPEPWYAILNGMNQKLKHRGPDEDGVWLSRFCGFAHTRLSIIDQKNGQQPMQISALGRTCTIVFNGEIYNMPALRRELCAKGALFTSQSDTEVILQGYLMEGASFIEQLNGIFAIALWDSYEQSLYLFRDRLGVKPLFYTKFKDTLLFSSELKGIFSYPGYQPVLDRDSLCEIFALGPASTYGSGVFSGIKEVLPGHYLRFQNGTCSDHCYWRLYSKPHTDSWEKTVEKTGWLIEDAVKLEMLSDIPISTFLSGGIDSSLVTAICARELEKQGKTLNTFSFDFTGNADYFKPNSFQPSQDRPWVERMVAHCHTNHHFLECDTHSLYDCLFDAVDARDLPCMADVESSMLYFCSQVVSYNKVTLTGECADEIFGGYPWFHKKEAFETDAFPWSYDLTPRKALLSEELLADLPLDEYAHAAYAQTIAETPRLSSDSPLEKRRREISYLNLKWFMANLLNRMDRTSMHSGLEARVPFADHRIVEYVWNVPWEMKQHGNIVKSLLRHAADGMLPKEVLWRRKSPYPKTYNPEYEALLWENFREVLADPNAPLLPLISHAKAEAFLASPQDYGKPWYGQLMAGPQLIAYFLQINYWLKKYRIQIRL